MPRTRVPKVDIVRDESKEKSEIVINCHYDYGERPMIVQSSTGDTYSIACAMTPKLSEMVPRTPFEVQQVSFTLYSRDQGWGGDVNAHAHSPYEGSWTWFDARIIRNVDITSVYANSGTEGDLESKEQIVAVHDLDGDTRTIKDSSVPRNITTAVTGQHNHWQDNSADIRILYDDRDLWTIQRNRRANQQYFEHHIVWNRGDVVEPAPVQHYVDTTGRGQNYGFVEALGIEDRIAVIAKAKFAGWENMVKKVTVQIVCKMS